MHIVVADVRNNRRRVQKSFLLSQSYAKYVNNVILFISIILCCMYAVVCSVLPANLVIQKVTNEKMF